MDKHKHKDVDLVNQPYKGPGPTVAGLGEGAIQAKFLTLSGLVVGGVAAAVFPKQTSKVVERIQKSIENAAHSGNGFKKILGDFGNFTLGIGKHTAEIFTKSKLMKDKFTSPEKAAKIERIVDGAIIASAAGSILGVFTGGAHGVASARNGKRQVKELQEEVAHLRKKVVDKETEIDDIKTANAARTGALKVAADTQHDTADASEQKTNWADTVAAEKSAAKETPLSL